MKDMVHIRRKMHKINRQQRQILLMAKVILEDAASILGLQDLLLRKPFELSGGQRQRVAMGLRTEDLTIDNGNNSFSIY